MSGSQSGCYPLFHEGWYVDDITVDSAQWTTIAEKGSIRHNVGDQPDGTYVYRVAALFNDRGFGRFLQGSWSDVVDITANRWPQHLESRARTWGGPDLDERVWPVLHGCETRGDG